VGRISLGDFERELERNKQKEAVVGFTKEKTVTVSAEDFLESDAVAHAEFEHDGLHYLIQVEPYTDAPNPRMDWDHAWTWATTRGAGYSDKEAVSLDDWEAMGKAEKAQYLYYPLGLLRHSGDTVYVGAGAHPHDPGGWDSGCMGVAYITKEDAMKEWGSVWKNGELVKEAKRLSKRARERAFAGLKGEVEEMNMWLCGQVYGILLVCLETEEQESSWGCYCENKQSIAEYARELLPAGMTKEAEDAVLDALEWA
jgi:hypothetical protein